LGTLNLKEELQLAMMLMHELYNLKRKKKLKKKLKKKKKKKKKIYMVSVKKTFER